MHLTLIHCGVARMSHLKLFGSVALMLGLALGLSACSPEEYGVCSIPNTSKARAACSATQDQAATCVIEHIFDCDSLLCGVYNNDGPYCTRRCVPSLCYNLPKRDANGKIIGYEEPVREETVDDQGNSVVKLKCGTQDVSCPPGKTCVDTCPDADEGAVCVEWTKGTSAFYCVRPSGNAPVSNVQPEDTTPQETDETDGE